MTEIQTDTTSPVSAHERYDEYKDSGVEWLQEIPAHWDIKPLKHAVEIDPESLSEDTDEDFELRYVDIGSVNSTGDIEKTQEYRFKDAPSRARKIVRDGDTIISTVRTYLRAIAHITAPPPNLVVSTGFAVLRPRQDVNERFLGRLISSKQFVDSAVAHSKGIGYPAISTTELGNLPVWIPPRSEQRVIAAYLDRETERIDTLIGKKERLIELLEEKRTALISRVVTKGLDPEVEMKDTNIEGLHKVPSHWKVGRFGYYCTIRKGQVDPEDDKYADRILIAPNHVESGSGHITETKTAREQGASSGKYIVNPGEIIYSKIRPELNKACLAEGDWLCSADMYPVQVGEEYVTEYLLYYILSRLFVQLMVNESMRVAMPKVNRETLSAAPLLLPPKSEQEKIVRYIERESARIDGLISKVEEAIERLKEYRTALISAAVTGQIDVREAVTVEQKPAKEIDTWARMNLVLELIRRMRAAGHDAFGRVMLVKMLYLIQHHLRVKGMQLTYHRKPFGPYDPQIRYGIEKDLEEQGWYAAEQTSDTYAKVNYQPLEKAKDEIIADYFEESWGDVADNIDRIVEQFQGMNATQAEIFTTLYAAWNDLRIDGQDPSDDDIIHEVLHNWHERKQEIPESRWRSALTWMRDEGWVPTGFGERTKQG